MDERIGWLVNESPESLKKRYEDMKVQLCGARRVLYTAQEEVMRMELEMMEIVGAMIEKVEAEGRVSKE